MHRRYRRGHERKFGWVASGLGWWVCLWLRGEYLTVADRSFLKQTDAHYLYQGLHDRLIARSQDGGFPAQHGEHADDLPARPPRERLSALEPDGYRTRPENCSSVGGRL